MKEHRVILAATLLLYAALCVIGLRWGLPSRDIDGFLFGDGPAWSGEEIYKLGGGDAWSSPERGADVDADPIDRTVGPVNLTATRRGAAAIYLRYRLYTHQPDEMITMRALGAMRPGQWHFDPKLYQYGGLFIFPVGGLLKLCGMLGVIDVRGDVVYYLDRPEEFGKFYVVARAYAAAWGAVGVLVVFAIGRRLKDARAGAVAALLFALLPVVVCLSHEGKPHLPGAVLMLLAVLAAMQYVDTGRRRDRVFLCVACGAALGMVLSSLPIFVLIPLVEVIRLRSARQECRGSSRGIPPGRTPQGSAGVCRSVAAPSADLTPAVNRTLLGLAVASGIYLLANPYIVINAVTNRAVLRSNFANSLAMYEVSRVGEGLVRVLELTAEGATLPVLVVGLVALAVAARRRYWATAPLAVPAGLIFLQFILLGAGKPAEYGRFGVFPDAALAIAAACGLTGRWSQRRRLVNWIPATVVVLATGWGGGAYLANFHRDSTTANTRNDAAHYVAARLEVEPGCVVQVAAEPAPYCCPPLNFAATEVRLSDRGDSAAGLRPRGQQKTETPGVRTPERSGSRRDLLLIETYDVRPRPVPVDRPGSDREQRFESRPLSPISWANKPIRVRIVNGGG